MSACLGSVGLVFFGCNVGLMSPTVDEPPPDVGTAVFKLDASADTQPQAATATPEEAGASDTKPVAAPKYVPGTSPLCNVAAGGGCNPDTVACVYDATDAGADASTCTKGSTCDPEEGGPPVLQAACRVESSSPMCSIAYGTSGAERCTTSSDCDIGYECIGATGAQMGTCKHYCCFGNATCASLGSNWFCDIEPVFHGISDVPVCTLGEPCTPLGSDCGSDTCTLVNEVTFETACASPGLAAAGESCAKVKCGADLACISNTCKQLCELMGPDGGPGECPADQTCLASSLLGAYAHAGLCGVSALP